jgi:hypothetical protein
MAGCSGAVRGIAADRGWSAADPIEIRAFIGAWAYLRAQKGFAGAPSPCPHAASVYSAASAPPARWRKSLSFNALYDSVLAAISIFHELASSRGAGSMSMSSPPDAMERLFALSPDEQRVFTLEAPPRPSGAIEAPASRDVAVDGFPGTEAATIDSEECAAAGKKTGGEGFLATLVEGMSDLLELVFSDVFGSLLKWLLD